MRKNTANCICFYNTQLKHINYRDWIDNVMNTVGFLHLDFTYIGTFGSRYSDKLIPFEKGIDRMNKKKYENIEGLTLIVNPKESDAPSFDWVVLIGDNLTVLGHELIICIDEGLISFKSADFKKIISNALSYWDFQYGYGYRRVYEKGPEFYPSGILQDTYKEPLPEQEKEAITKWLHDSYEGKSFKEGRLRDLYPYNILSDFYLQRLVNGMPLKQWIELDSTRGDLTSYPNGLVLWEIDNHNLIQIREELNHYGLLLCYHKTVLPSI
jgi:hypothetical protein